MRLIRSAIAFLALTVAPCVAMADPATDGLAPQSFCAIFAC